MSNEQMMGALALLPDPELVQAGKITDPLGSNSFYSARTVVQLLEKQRKEMRRAQKLATRYQFLRDQAMAPSKGLEYFVAIYQLDHLGDPERFDALIDEEMRKQSADLAKPPAP